MRHLAKMITCLQILSQIGPPANLAGSFQETLLGRQLNYRPVSGNRRWQYNCHPNVSEYPSPPVGFLTFSRQLAEESVV